jgi:hypothetical protein
MTNKSEGLEIANLLLTAALAFIMLFNFLSLHYEIGRINENVRTIVMIATPTAEPIRPTPTPPLRYGPLDPAWTQAWVEDFSRHAADWIDGNQDPNEAYALLWCASGQSHPLDACLQMLRDSGIGGPAAYQGLIAPVGHPSAP